MPPGGGPDSGAPHVLSTPFAAELRDWRPDHPGLTTVWMGGRLCRRRAGASAPPFSTTSLSTNHFYRPFPDTDHLWVGPSARGEPAPFRPGEEKYRRHPGLSAILAGDASSSDATTDFTVWHLCMFHDHRRRKV